jgi:transcription antitermination protein NusB
MQALYQWQLNALPSLDVVNQYLADDEAKGADHDYFTEIVTTVIDQYAAFDELISAEIDRPIAQIDPTEHAILWVGSYELRDRLDVPYRVVINEGVELTKRFGATDAHKYINAVLDKIARKLRAAERGG